jgi:hypothetical protein
MPRESTLADDFESKISGLKDPAAFLSAKVQENKQKVNLIRNLRSAAIALMVFLFGWQLVVNFRSRPKPKGA